MSVDVDALIHQYMGLAQSLARQQWRTAPHALELDEMVGIAHVGLVSAARRWVPYCVTPETLVLTAQLRWVPVGSVQVGDELIGTDENLPGPKRPRRYQSAIVERSVRKVAECVELTFTDGSQVKCTLDHKWLTRVKHNPARYGNGSKWQFISTDQIVPGDSIAAPVRVWSDDQTHEAGWLAGIIDGEACLHTDYGRHAEGRGAARTVIIAQNDGAVLNKIKEILAALDIPVTVRTQDRQSRCHRVSVSHRMHALEMLGRVRPVRFDSRLLWMNAAIYSKGSGDLGRTVESIRAIGPAEVVALTTSSRTYIANGLVAHNCNENGHDPNALQFFKPYVVRRVYGSLIDAIRSTDWATRSLRTRAKALQEAGQDKGLSETELAERSGMTVKEVRSTIRGMAQRPVSLEAEELDPVAGTGVESDAFTADVLGTVVGTIRDLEPEQQVVLALHYFKGLQLQEVARTMGISESRASQLHAKGVLAVHQSMITAVQHRESP